MCRWGKGLMRNFTFTHLLVIKKNQKYKKNEEQWTKGANNDSIWWIVRAKR